MLTVDSTACSTGAAPTPTPAPIVPPATTLTPAEPPSPAAALTTNTAAARTAAANARATSTTTPTADAAAAPAATADAAAVAPAHTPSPGNMFTANVHIQSTGPYCSFNQNPRGLLSCLVALFLYNTLRSIVPESPKEVESWILDPPHSIWNMAQNFFQYDTNGCPHSK